MVVMNLVHHFLYHSGYPLLIRRPIRHLHPECHREQHPQQPRPRQSPASELWYNFNKFPNPKSVSNVTHLSSAASECRAHDQRLRWSPVAAVRTWVPPMSASPPSLRKSCISDPKIWKNFKINFLMKFTSQFSRLCSASTDCSESIPSVPHFSRNGTKWDRRKWSLGQILPG